MSSCIWYASAPLCCQVFPLPCSSRTDLRASKATLGMLTEFCPQVARLPNPLLIFSKILPHVLSLLYLPKKVTTSHRPIWMLSQTTIAVPLPQGQPCALRTDLSTQFVRLSRCSWRLHQPSRQLTSTNSVAAPGETLMKSLQSLLKPVNMSATYGTSSQGRTPRSLTVWEKRTGSDMSVCGKFRPWITRLPLVMNLLYCSLRPSLCSHLKPYFRTRLLEAP